MRTLAQSGIFKPQTRLNLLTSTPQISPIRSSHREAFDYPHWKSAMTDKYNALMKKHTWELVHCLGPVMLILFDVIGCLDINLNMGHWSDIRLNMW